MNRPDASATLRNLLAPLLVCVLASSAPARAAEQAPPPDRAAPDFLSPRAVWWVVPDREWPLGLRRLGTVSPGKPVVVTESGRARCVSVVASGTPNRLSLRAEWDSFSATFHVLRADGRWRLRSPAVTDRLTGFELHAWCTCDFEMRDDATEAFFPTSAGPIFRDERACHEAAKKGYERSCEGTVCRYPETAAPVFELGDCDKALQQAQRTLSVLREATEAERLAALNRALALWRQGGVVFESRTDGCRAWKVRPTGALKARLRWTKSAPEGRFLEEMEYELVPLQRRALEHSHRSESPGGAGASGGTRAQPLHFARARMYLGDRWMHFDRGACERAAKGL